MGKLPAGDKLQSRLFLFLRVCDVESSLSSTDGKDSRSEKNERRWHRPVVVGVRMGGIYIKEKDLWIFRRERFLLMFGFLPNDVVCS